jgi:ElaB/YqjD/DUF883 family membrane-anchored ribosome-binding protein
MPQQSRLFNSATDRTTPVHVAALALRGVGQVYDMNVAAARVLLQTQARAASAFGWPDWSGLFERVDDRARNVFSASAEQLLQTAQRAKEATTDLQRQVGRVVETQAATVAETWQHGLEELGTQANEGLNQLLDTARQQADEAERVAASLAEEVRESVQQAGEQVREGLHRGRESLQQTTDAAREQTEHAADAARSAEDKNVRRSKAA